MADLAQKVLRYIRSHSLLRAGQRVGIAVSGGADSVALLRALLDLRAELGIVLAVAHFDHQIRGTDSADDANFVRALAEQHQLEFHLGSGDTPAYAKREGLSLETAARVLRYKFFNSLLDSGKTSRIVTAHTLDDQAETVLMRMLRGAGTRGLAAILPTLDLGSHRHAVIRLLLQVRRAETEEYLRSISQPWREDSSNRSLHHTRNRVRQELLPLLQGFNPQAASTLAEGAEIARAEEQYWTEIISALLPQVFLPETAALNADALLKYPLAIQRRLVLAAAERTGLTLDFAHVEELLALAKQPAGLKPKAHPLPGGHAFHAHSKDASSANGDLQLRCGNLSPQRPSVDYEYMLPVPGEVHIAEIRSTIRVSLLEAVANSPGALPAHASLCVRNWRAGDRFQPAHTRAPKKIKELLQSVPAVERGGWPVVSCGQNVIWMRGFTAHAALLWISPTGENYALLIEEVTSGSRDAAKAALQGTIAQKDSH